MAIVGTISVTNPSIAQGPPTSYLEDLQKQMLLKSAYLHAAFMRHASNLPTYRSQGGRSISLVRSTQSAMREQSIFNR